MVVDSEQSIVLDLKNTYYQNGKVKSSGGYVDGQKEGTHRVYDEDGNQLDQDTEIWAPDLDTEDGILEEYANALASSWD